MQTETLHRPLDDPELALLVVEGLGDDKGEIEIPVVVVDGSAAGLAAHQVAAVGFQGFHIALAEGVLVLSNNHGTAVAPEVKHDTIGMFNEVVLYGDIPIGVGLVGDDELEFHYFNDKNDKKNKKINLNHLRNGN